MQDNLLLLRKKHNKSQKDLADLLEISTKAYSSKENGKTEFTMNEMFKISDYFNKSIEDIFLPSLLQNGVKEQKE